MDEEITLIGASISSQECMKTNEKDKEQYIATPLQKGDR